MNLNQMQNIDPVMPLQASENRWDRKAIAAIQVEDSPELVERKVKGLLNKLTMKNFDSISDQIIAWANKSEKEKDGRTRIQVIRLVFEKATDEAIWSEMYARLCRKMMEEIRGNVQDDGIKNREGKPIAGGQLFRKYLLNRCQEDFERGREAKEVTAAAAFIKALEDEAANTKTKEGGSEEIVLYSDECYAARKIKRQGFGVIRFIGELFKLEMLTERIMHECVKLLLYNANVDNPEEVNIEGLCKLLATVGSMLDIPEARALLNYYFSLMQELMERPNVTLRMQFMLQDLLDLRERKWVARNAVVIQAAKEKFNPPQVEPDSWVVAGGWSYRRPPPPRAGHLSNFRNISKVRPLTFGPSSVFAGKKGAENEGEAIPRTNSSSNMFSMLSSQAEAGNKDIFPAAEPLPLHSVPVEVTSVSSLPPQHPTTIAQIPPKNANRSPESTSQPPCLDGLASVVTDGPSQKKSDSFLTTGSGELDGGSPSQQSPYGSMGPPYEAEWLRILLNASQENLRLQQRQFEEEKITMIRHFKEQQQIQRAQFDAERMFYQSQIKALSGYHDGEK